MDRIEPTLIFCRYCTVGFALGKDRPEYCPNEACGMGGDWWRLDSPTPLRRYNLTDGDKRLLRGFRINPE